MDSATSPMSPEGEAHAVATQRPGLVTFAAIIMYLLAAFQLMFAILEFVRASWVAANVSGTFGGPLWTWALVDVAFALIIGYAATDVLRGGTFGRIFGIMLAGLSALRWFFYIPASPWVAIVFIALDVVVIYGLAAHTDFFRAKSAV